MAVVSALRSVFTNLRELLAAHAAEFTVAESAQKYQLEAPIGPATVQAWGGKVRTQTIPVAWVEVRKAYVSYHLMGIASNSRLVASLSAGLHAHMHGKSCFNFNKVDSDLMPELGRVTSESLLGMKKAGYISDR
jgi:hypothetical protein